MINSSKSFSFDEIKSILTFQPLQEFQNQFIQIIDDIFGENSNWELFTKNRSKDEAKKVMELLNPEGILFQSIYGLMNSKSNLLYEFSVIRLPEIIQRSIFENRMDDYLKSKVYPHFALTFNISLNQCKYLYLNAFEYFAFSFITALTLEVEKRQRLQYSDSLNLASTETVYCVLFQRYLEHCFFLSSSCPVSATAHNLMMPGGGTRSQPKRTEPELPPGLAFTDALVQAVLQLWVVRFCGSVTSSRVVAVAVSAKSSQSLPSVAHVCFTRIFLKHLYHFAYSPTITGSAYLSSQFGYDAFCYINVYRQQQLPKLVLDKLTLYLVTLFQEWPADLTFKIVLELWLSVLQPARYMDAAHHDQPTQQSQQHRKIMVEWCGDVDILYGNLLQLLTRRLLRMDLTVPRTANMLSRVARVLGGSSHVAVNISTTSTHWKKTRSAIWSLLVHVMRVCAVLETRITDTHKALNKSWPFSQLWGRLWDSPHGFCSSSLETWRRTLSSLQQSTSILAREFQLEAELEKEENFVDPAELLSKQQIAQHEIEENCPQLTDIGQCQLLTGLSKSPLNISANDSILSCSRSNCNTVNNINNAHNENWMRLLHRLLFGKSIKSIGGCGYYERPVLRTEFGLVVKACRSISRFICCNQIAHSKLVQVTSRADMIGNLTRYYFVDSDSSTNTNKFSKFCLPLRPLASKPLLFWGTLFSIILIQFISLSGLMGLFLVAAAVKLVLFLVLFDSSLSPMDSSSSLYNDRR